MPFSGAIRGRSWAWPDLRTLLARASPRRAADELAGLAAGSELERAAARAALADVPLAAFLAEDLVPGEHDEVTRLIRERHDPVAFAPVRALTVGGLREWLLEAEETALAGVRAGLTPEMV